MRDGQPEGETSEATALRQGGGSRPRGGARSKPSASATDGIPAIDICPGSRTGRRGAEAVPPVAVGVIFKSA